MKCYINDQVIVADLVVANSFYKRLKGLMFKKDLDNSSGLLLSPCNSVHTFFMNFNIDVLYLDKDYTIIALYLNVPPRRILPINRNCRHVLELKAYSHIQLRYSVGQKCIIK